MAATFDFQQYTGAATGSPALGTVLTTGTPPNNWKNIDDTSTAYSASPITAGNNSFTVYQFGKFSGTFTTISAGLWSAHTAPSGALATGLTLKGVVTSTYATPATTTNASLTVDFTTAVAIGSGQAVLFVATSPATASPGSSCSTNPCYTQFLATQLQTTSGAASGDIASITSVLQYNES